MNAYAGIFLHPLHEYRNQSGFWFMRALAAAPFIVYLLVGCLGGQWELALRAGALVLALPIFAWWIMHVQSSIRQYRPGVANLVPGLRRRLIVAWLVLWTTGSLLLGGAGAAVFGHFPLALLGAAAALLCFAAMTRHIWLAFVPPLFLPTELTKSLPVPSPAMLLDAWGATNVAAVGLAILAAIAAWLCTTLHASGSDKHWAWHRKQAEKLELLTNGNALPASSSTTSDLFSIWFSPYSAALKRASKGAPGGKLLLHVFGPNLHMSGQIQGIVLILASMLFLHALGAAGMGPSAGKSLEFLIAMTLLPPVLYARTANHAMHQTRAEQALARLSPAAPNPDRLNRFLARALLSRFLAVWLLAAASAAVVGHVAGDGQGMAYALSLSALTLPFGCMLLRDFSAMKAPAADHSFVALAGLLAAALGANLFARALAQGLPWEWMGAGAAVLAGVTMPLLWWRMMSAPPALPAARMAAR